jgi:formylglycine-generating enzyme required for sulfatase activity
MPPPAAPGRGGFGPPDGGAPPRTNAAIEPAPKKGKARRALLPALLAVVVLGAGAAYAISQSGGDDGGGSAGANTSSTTTGDSTATTAPPLAPVGKASEQNMVQVPAGQYAVGADQPERDSSETKRMTQDVQAYWIDVHEVTNREFGLFIDSQGGTPPAPASWQGGRMPADKPQNPVQGVSFDLARAYCSALGKRLPSEVEWEVAAKGGTDRAYPWGDNVADVPLPTDDSTYEVGSVAGNVSPFGVFDMVGNAWEWVGDSYDPRVKPEERVLRGGANGYLRKNSVRLPVDPTGSNALKIAGFRCAATETDPTVAPLAFGKVEVPTTPVTPTTEPLPPNVLLLDNFKDPTSGWVESSGDTGRYGYHPNEYYHLESKGPGHDVIAIAPSAPEPNKPVRLNTEAFVDPNNTDPSGSFDFGLAVRFDPDSKRGLVFIVNPRESVWLICERKVDGTFNVLAKGPRAIPDPVKLQVDVKANDVYDFRIGDAVVHTRQIPGYSGTGMGLYVLGETSPKAHIHFDSFEMQVLS